MRHSNRLVSAGLLLVSATVVYGLPPTTGAQWWSTDPNLNCSTFHSLVHEISLQSGGKGYACGVTGSFIWLAAGGDWKTSIRTAAPSTGPIGIEYAFFDQDGQRVSLDTNTGNTRITGNTVSLALNPNQASDIQISGASSDGPAYRHTQTGSVFVLLLCPDAATCATALPQLVYSSAPSKPWLLSVPIAWDASYSVLQPSGIATRWSAVGIQDGGNVVSFAIYNQSTSPASYVLRVYDGSGTLVGQGTTSAIPAGGGASAGGTRGFLLTDIVGSGIPAGPVKVTVEGTGPASAMFLQFSGESATSLQATHDLVPGAVSSSL